MAHGRSPGWVSSNSPDRGTRDCKSCSKVLAPIHPQPDSRDVAFGVAPRINAAGRMAHPAEALAVFEAALDDEAAQRSVNRLNQLNHERRQVVKVNFEELVESIGTNVPAGLVIYRETSPKGIAGLLASKCVEKYSVPSIVLVPSTTPGLVVGSGRSMPGIDLVEHLRPFSRLFVRFGGHAQAVGITMALEHIQEFQDAFAGSFAHGRRVDGRSVNAEAELCLSTIGRHFHDQLLMLEPFGVENPAPVFSIGLMEVVSAMNRWVRVRQGRHSIEVLSWDLAVNQGMKGDCLVEFHGKTLILRGFTPRKA
jgi:single-stranded-DNA-specific exonuclease